MPAMKASAQPRPPTTLMTTRSGKSRAEPSARLLAKTAIRPAVPTPVGPRRSISRPAGTHPTARGTKNAVESRPACTGPKPSSAIRSGSTAAWFVELVVAAQPIRHAAARRVTGLRGVGAEVRHRHDPRPGRDLLHLLDPEIEVGRVAVDG